MEVMQALALLITRQRSSIDMVDQLIAMYGRDLFGVYWPPGQRNNNGMFTGLYPILGALRQKGLAVRGDIIDDGQKLGYGYWTLTDQG